MRLKECINNLQQVEECEKFVDNSWLWLWSEVAEDIGSGDGAVVVEVQRGQAVVEVQQGQALVEVQWVEVQYVQVVVEAQWV